MEMKKIEQQKVDRFLLGIVGGVVVLIVVALVLVWQTPAALDYQAEDMPEGVAMNYLLALQREEYERAYNYLAPDLPHYPADAGKFFVDVQPSCFNNRERSEDLAIEDVNIVGQQAIVTMVETVYYGEPNLFSSNSYKREVAVTLKQIDGRWYVSKSERCWFADWTKP